MRQTARIRPIRSIGATQQHLKGFAEGIFGNRREPAEEETMRTARPAPMPRMRGSRPAHGGGMPIDDD